MEGSDHEDDENTSTTLAPAGPPEDRRSEESNGEWDRLRSFPATTKPRKATTRNFECKKSLYEPEWESLTRVVARRIATMNSNSLKGLNLDPPETLNGDDNKWKDLQRFDKCVNAWQTVFTFKDIDLNNRTALEFVVLNVTNSALVSDNQFQREQQEKDHTSFNFMLALRIFLIPSISKDLCDKSSKPLHQTRMANR